MNIPRLLSRLRYRVFSYEDPAKNEQAERLISRCKIVLEPEWEARHRQLMDDRLDGWMALQ